MDTIYPSTIVEEYFDSELLELYWRFIAERQAVYFRRGILGAPRSEWTDDPIIRTEFITNMYRELDPGTAYVLSDILTLPKPEDRVFHVLMYRLMGSQADTHRRLIAATPTAKSFTTDKYLAALEGIEKGKLFGDAYRVAGYEKHGGATKAENVGIMFADIAKSIPSIYKDLKAATHAREAYEVIKSIEGFGEFLAHQVTVDLLYAEPTTGDAVLPFGDDSWAFPGPGARNGIWTMLRPGIKPRSLLIVMEWLRDHQQEYFNQHGLEFPTLLNADGSQKWLSVCNIQSTLCEFYKYVRLWDGSTKSAVRRYQPGSEVGSIPVFPTFGSDDELYREKIHDLYCQTLPPPVGGRAVPEAAAAPAPEVDPGSDTEENSVREYLGAANEHTFKDCVSIPAESHTFNTSNFEGQVSSLDVPLPSGGSLTINIVINVNPQQ
jgi:hypothetical protein